MKPFHFQKFVINQDQNVFRVGTDGVLLGSLASVENSKNILEVGTGTGLISLMVAQRNSAAKILALDINIEAVHLAEENFKNSPFEKQLTAKHVDFNRFEGAEKFDLIISNPPYFVGNSSEKDIFARQQTALTFTDLIKNAAAHLSDNGVFSVIIPFEDGVFFEKQCMEFNLKLHRKIRIFGIKNSKPKRWIFEFGFKEQFPEEKDFIIEKSPRIYTEEYLNLTKDFHLFKK